ncbi:MAG: choice-of-anchor J domain-containing protein [bacterium]
MATPLAPVTTLPAEHPWHPPLRAPTFSEDFQEIEVTVPPYDAFPSGWALFNVDGRTPAGSVGYITHAWIVREDFITNVTDKAAFSTSWYSPAGQADDWMITPAVSLSASERLSWNALAPDASYPDGYEVRISTTTADPAGCSANPALFSIAAESSTWTARSLELATAGYANESVYLCFRNHTNDKFLLLLDDIAVESTYVHDAAIAGLDLPSEYTILPANQGFSLTLGADVDNNGTQAITQTALGVSVQVDGSTVATPTGSPVASILSGASAHLTAPDYVADEPGVITLDYAVSSAETEDKPDDNAASWNKALSVAAEDMARDDGIVVSAIGIGAGQEGELGQAFEVTVPSRVDSVQFAVNAADPAIIGTDLVFRLRAYPNGGPPGTLLGTSYAHTFADELGHTATVSFPPDLAPLAPGKFFISAVETPAATIALGQTTDVFTAGTEWVIWPSAPGGTWNTVEGFGASFQKPFVIRPRVIANSVFADGFETGDLLRWSNF